MLDLRVVVGALAVCVGAFAVLAPEEYVDTISGTHSRYDLSHGNILPEVALPWYV